MSSSPAALYVLMFVAGCAVPMLASINAALGARLGNPFAAVLVLCVVASLGAAAVLLVSSRAAPLPSLAGAAPWQYLGGLFFLVYIGSVTFAVPYIGLGNAIFVVLVGQLVTAAAIDHFGLLGAPLVPLSARRAIGLSLMALGALLARRELLPTG